MQPLVASMGCLLILLVSHAGAQQVIAQFIDGGSSKFEVESNPSAPVSSPSAQIDSLRKKRTELSQYLETVDPSSRDYDETVSSIRELDVQLHALMAGSTTASAQSAPTVQALPRFELATPGDNLTNESVHPTLSWTEDLNPAPRPTIERYIVEISHEKDFDPSSVVYKNEEVEPQPHPLSILYPIPEGSLQPGITYYWRVFAVYAPSSSSPPAQQIAVNAPFSFTTARSLFQRFSDKGFRLQRAVEGPDAGKGAEFSVLRTLGKDSVYTADFALIYNHRPSPTSRTSVAFQTSVEGKLTSDESEQEDAWRLRAGAVFDRWLQPDTLSLMHLSLGGKFESDQDFDVKKLSFETLFTPAFPDLFIGVITPLHTASPLQFMWRPFLSVDAGGTIKRGSSGESENTIFRLMPRVTARLKLNFLNKILKLHQVYLWMDNTFYYFPLESETERNFFTCGLEFEVTEHIGLGITYKNGESAPRFNRIHTLGGTISISFS